MTTTARRRRAAGAVPAAPVDLALGPADGGLEPTGHVVVSRDKAFGRIIGRVDATPPEGVQAVVDRAAAAWPAWAANSSNRAMGMSDRMCLAPTPWASAL